MSINFLLSLGALTLGGAAAVIIFALLSRILRTRYAARWRCWIWLILSIRLIVPISLTGLGSGGDTKAPIQVTVPSDVVIYEPTPAPSVPIQTTDPGIVPSPGTTPDIYPAVTPGVSGGELQPDPEDPDGFDGKISISRILGLVWGTGVVTGLIWVSISHIRFLRYLKRWSELVEESALLETYRMVGEQLGLKKYPVLRVCPGIKAPMLVGGLRYSLLLPETILEDESGKYVLLHELTHYKRRDILLKTFALLANVIHWFNPLIWYMVHLVERDTELACDEAVLRQLPHDEHADYGRTILRTVESLKGNG